MSYFIILGLKCTEFDFGRGSAPYNGGGGVASWLLGDGRLWANDQMLMDERAN